MENHDVVKKVENSKDFYPVPLTPVQKSQFVMPTYALLGILVVCFILIKSFIYIKDEKRHGK